MNWRHWKLGLAIAFICSLLTAGSGASGGMTWGAFIAVFCTSMLTNLGNFLFKHPIEDVNFDTTTTTIKKTTHTPVVSPGETPKASDQ